ncbi:MAG: undecaprenyldiphospho-muramoylpentapeptide beta-N-acetylglucosaminyltransferase, partial [Candidatus Methylopumilus sp.]|nr:undecaprenyldiphospho-muramoylpentapeptide beta-N-acetylglucosaminyltransferase [Candidatus Methylopumilus sp.]
MLRSNKKILMIAGGTGGHIYPGIAIADYLKTKGWLIVWLGTKHGMENRLIEAKPYQKAMIDITGVRGKSILSWLKLPSTLFIACIQCAKVIREEKPDVVIAMGGYVSFPGGFVARIMRKPLIVHEQNSIPGLTNRLLAIIATRIYSAFPIKLIKTSYKIGNPVRDSISNIKEPFSRFKNRKGPLRLLVVGGSLGAKFFNDIVPLSIQQIHNKKRPIIIHQSGEKHDKELKATYKKYGVKADCRAYLNNIEKMYEWADLVIARAGALTVSEFSSAGIASILVPFPFAVDNHQFYNAKYLSDKKAA